MVAFTGGAGTYNNNGTVYEWSDVIIVVENNVIVDYFTQFAGDALPGPGTAVTLGNPFNVQLTSLTYKHLGGPVSASTLTISSQAKFLQAASGFTINGKLTNNGSMTVVANTIATGEIETNRVLTVGDGGSDWRFLLLRPVNGDFTTSGVGNLRLNNGFLTGEGGNSSITDLSNSTKISGHGQIGSAFGLAVYPSNGGYLSITNTAAGVIQADVAGKTLTINTALTEANPLVNAGLMAASGGGTLYLNGREGSINGSSLHITQSGAGTIKAFAGSTVELNDVVVTGGTLDGTAAGTGVIRTTGFDDRLVDLDITANGRVEIAGILALEGTIENRGKIVQNGSNSSTRIDADDVTLNGGGSFQLVGAYDLPEIIGEAAGAVLTNTNHTIFGRGTISGGNLSIINSGVIAARPDAYSAVDTDVLDLDALAGLTNTGTLEASGAATLQIRSIAGTINNTGGTIRAVGVGSKVELGGVTVSGGTLHTDANGIINAAGAVKLIGLATTATTTLDAGGAMTFEGAIVNKGTILVNDSNGRLYIDDDDVLLTGGGTILMVDPFDESFIVGQAPGAVLTNFDNTIRGEGFLGGGNLTLANSGTIAADDAGLFVIQDLASFTNTGNIEARSGGTLQLNNPADGSIANAGGTIRSTGAGSMVNLGNTVIKGGTLVGVDGGKFGTNGTTWDGSVSKLTATNVDIDSANILKIKGTIEHSGTAHFYDRSVLFIDGDTTLSGGGTFVTHYGYVDDAAVRASATGFTLDNVNNTFAGRGDFGAGGRFSGAGFGFTFINGAAGTVTANEAGATLNIVTGNTITNNGRLVADGGILNVLDNLTGTGRIEITNGGTAIVDQGTDQRVVFIGASADTLSLSRREGASGGFDFTVGGMGVGDRIRLDVGYGAGAEQTFAFTYAGGVTTLRSAVFADGSAQTYAINLLGQYSEGQFQFIGGSDGALGLLRVQSRDGGTGADTFTAVAGGERLVGLNGDDLLISGAGDDVLDGSRGIDTVDYRLATSGVTVSLDTMATQAVGGGLGNDRIYNMENLTGSAHADTLTGNALANRITGGAGGDTQNGGAGNDIFLIGSQATFGGDTIDGGTEIDRIRFTSTKAGETLTLTSAVTQVEIAEIMDAAGSIAGTVALNLNASAVATGMTLTGNNGANTITGTAQADTIDGNGGSDTLNGGAGIDTLNGGSENDVLNGGSGDDTLNAGSGNDELVGASGKDTLIGASGLDSFVFNSTLGASNIDIIQGFNHNDDVILLDADIFTKAGPVGALSAGFFWAGTAAHDANDRIIYNAATGSLSYDADGIGGVAQIQFATITGIVGGLTTGDFAVIA